MEFTTDVVSKLIDSYTRESGVRNLEREIGSVCRAKAVQYAEAKDSAQLGKLPPHPHLNLEFRITVTLAQRTILLK